MQSGRYKRRLTKTKKMVHVRLSAGELAIGSIKVDSWSAFFFSSFIRFNRWREVSSFC